MKKKDELKYDKRSSGGELRRNISLFEGTIYGISFVIGTGIFLKPSVVLANTGSTAAAMLFWIVGGLISMCSALTIAEIAAYIPKLGGMYTYITEIYGELVGYIYGWVEILISGPGGAAASSIAFATFASYFIQLSDSGVKVLAIAIIWLLGLIQMASTKGSMRMQVVGTIGKLVPIAAIVTFGLIKGDIPGAVNFSAVGGSAVGGTAAALLGVLWAYDGWISTASLGGEIVRPEKNLPKAIIMALTFVIAVYAIFNFVIFRTIPADQVTNSASIGIDVSKVLFGAAGATLITLGMLVSSATTLNAQVMSATRTVLAMSRRRQIIGSKFLAYINPKLDTPINSLLFMLIVATIYILSGSFNSITNLVVFILWIFFVLLTVGIFKLRKNFPRDKELYSVPLYPVIPILGALGGIYLVISTVMSSITTALIGIVVALIGVPMYFYCRKKYN